MAEQAGYLDTVEQGLALHPEQAATSAAQVDLLFWVLVAVCVALVLTLFALVIGFSVRYRAGSRRPRPGAIAESLGRRTHKDAACRCTDGNSNVHGSSVAAHDQIACLHETRELEQSCGWRQEAVRGGCYGLG